MHRCWTSLTIAAALVVVASTARAQTSATAEPTPATHAVLHAPTALPGGAFRKVSELVELPDFLPGMGTLYVDPTTLPAGPFLAYDRDRQLVSTIYMIPLTALEEHQAFQNLGAANARVDHVDVVYNAGHPGVAEPHYHVVVWHVSPETAAALQ
jgi:hypothetical protein